MIKNEVNRRFDIDWLRIISTYLLFIFHVSKVFDIPPFYQIKNADLSKNLGYFTGFVHQWHMPLFFLLAGWSVYASLKKRGQKQFINERTNRILVPFLIGCILLCPPMQYVYAIKYLGFSGSFIEFFPSFFTSLEYFSWSHLWFLIYLFVFTLLYRPLFSWVIKKDFSLTHVSPVFVYLPVIVFIIIQVLLREKWPGFQNLYDDWGNFAYYSSFFILGFLFAAFPTFESTMHKQWPLFLIIATLALLTLGFTGIWQWPKAGWGMTAIAGYFMVTGILGAGHTYLSWTNPYLRHLTVSAYPVYLLHQISIVMPGYFIIQLPISIVSKFIILLFVSILTTMTIYQLVIQKYAITRFFFGMKILKNSNFAPLK